MRKTIKTLALAGASLLAATATAQAQDTTGASQATDDRLEDIVVTARRQSESLQRTPVAVTAFTASDLAARSVQNLAQIKDSTPNLYIVTQTADQFNVNIQIRGQLTNNTLLTLDPSIGIYVDGVYQGPTIGTPLNRLFDIERVEVLKGPQGTLYGRNTTGGAVNVYTKEPEYNFGGLVRGSVGRFGQREIGAVVNVPIVADQLAFRLVGEVAHSDGYGRDENNDRSLGRLTTRSLRGALRMDFSDRFSGMIRGEYQEGESGGDPAKPLFLVAGSNANREIAYELFGLPRTAVLTPAQLSAAFATYTAASQGSPFVTQYTRPLSLNYTSSAASATFKYKLGNATLTSITSYRHLYALRNQDVDGTRFIIVDGKIRQQLNQFTQELQLSGSTPDDRLKYVFGAYYFDSEGDDTSVSTALAVLNPANPSTTDGHVTANSKSVFGQVSYGFIPGLTFTGGLRYTKDKKGLDIRSFNPIQGCTIFLPVRVGGATGPCLARLREESDDISYTAGVDWVINDQLFVYAKTSKGYKGGGLNLRVNLSPNSVLPFRPENVTDYEVGLKADLLDKRLRMNIAYFHSKYKDIQRNVIVANGQAPASITQNAASAVIDGVEVEITAVPIEGLKLSANGAYLNPRYKSYLDNGVDVSGQSFQFFSKWAYGLSGAYTVPAGPGDLRMQLDWNWRSRMDFVPEAFRALPDSLRTQPSFGLLNGQIGYNLEDDKLRVSFYMRNITDKRYRANVNQLVTAGLGTVFYLPGAPRTFGVTITKEF